MKLNWRNLCCMAMSYGMVLSGGLRKIKKKASRGEIILSVYYHNPSKKLFEKTIRWFIRNGFHFISVDETEKILTGQQSFPASAVVLTVDDGWKDNKENIIEVANRYKIPVMIFATTQPVEYGDAFWWSYILEGRKKGLIGGLLNDYKKMNDDARMKIISSLKKKINPGRQALSIEELKQSSRNQNIQIGSHTVNHPILTNCSDEKSYYELTESKKTIEKWTGKTVDAFAYPNGCYGQREIDLLKKNGYKIAFTTVPEYIKRGQAYDLFEIPRFDVLENVSLIENICRMTGVWYELKPKKNKDGLKLT